MRPGKNEEVARVMAETVPGGVFGAFGEYRPGNVFNVYVLFTPSEGKLADLSGVFSDTEIMFEHVSIAFDADTSPRSVSPDMVVYEVNYTTSSIRQYETRGLSVKLRYVQFKVGYDVYSRLHSLLDAFPPDRTLRLRAFSSKAYKFLYNWCIYRSPLPDTAKTDWNETEWVAFILVSAGVVRPVHASYLTQRELFLLCFNAPIQRKDNKAAVRLVNTKEDTELEAYYKALFGAPPQSHALDEQSSFAVYMYNAVAPQPG